MWGAHRESARQQRDFELVTQHDVEVVGHLVGGDAICSRLHHIDAAIEGFAVEPFHRLGKERLQLRKDVMPEGAGAADMVLPQPRLAFVQSHAWRIAEQRVAVIGIEALIVKTVTALVHGGEHGG